MNALVQERPSDLASFVVTQKWPARHPERLQLYSAPTPNGAKVAILLEEVGLPYEPHLVVFAEKDQMSPAFLSVGPNNKIPAILDPNGPGGRPARSWCTWPRRPGSCCRPTRRSAIKPCNG